MAKSAGLNQRFFINGYDLSGDVGALEDASSPRETFDVTSLDKSANERLMGRGDGSMTFLTYFNDAAGQEHAALKGLPTTDIQAIWGFGASIGDTACGILAKQTDYAFSHPSDGSLSITVPLVSTGGIPLEWGKMLTAGKRTDSSATNGGSLDNAASSASGLCAYLQVFAFSGTSVTVTIQESSDNGSGDAFATKASFTAVSAANKQERITASGTVERYLRVVTTGTFSNAVFAVAVRRGTAEDDTAYT